MCFSARASFGAAIVLGGIGGVALRAAPTRKHAAFASIPLLFAAQQACEGALWLVLDDAPYHVSSTPLVRAFLFFALFVWPPYVPLSLALIEHSRGRRRALVAISAIGAALGAYLMACASLRASNACIAFGNLYYWTQIDTPLKHVVPFVYLACIVSALVTSTLRGTTWLAAAVVIAFTTTGVLYRAGFVSVWCFAAAILSGIVAVIACSGAAPQVPKASP